MSLGSFGFDRPDLLVWLPVFGAVIVAIAWQTRRVLSRRRMVLATTLRLALLACILLALAGLTRYRDSDELAVLFVLDRSASLDAQSQAQADDFVREALAHQLDGDLAGVVVFGAEAYVDAEPQEDLAFDHPTAAPSPHQTDVAAGLRLASALLPADRAGRVVLLSDGQQTRGDATSQSLITVEDGVELAVIPFSQRQGADARLDALLVPTRVDEGDAYDLRVIAHSDVDTTGRLRLYRDDTYLGEQAVTLSAERANVFSYRQRARSAGLARYRAALTVDDASADLTPQNNQVMASVQVSGRPRVLLIEGEAGSSRALAKVLGAQQLAVDVRTPAELPAGPEGLRAYHAVFLDNVPAYAMSRRQQEALRSYVADLGRGLVMIGGDRSFGLGGYYHTPVETALPVRMDLEDGSRFAKLGMVLAIDKSCSMGEGAGSKLGMAKEAAIQTAELMEDRDLLGVLGFDSAAGFVVPLQELTDRAEVTRLIASVRSGGGTDIYPAIQRGVAALDGSDAALKHVVVLSDGMTAGGAYETLLKDAVAKQITVTTIAIGDDADRATMQEFADWGGGNYYLVTDAQSIPAIFTREMMLASRSFLVEETVTPVMNDHSELLVGLGKGALPPLQGLVATQARPRATVALQVSRDEGPALPLLAHWRYGLGRSVAFTSDATTRWGQAWVGTPAYTQLWTQVARWVVGSTDDANLVLDAELVDGELRLGVDAFTDAGEYHNLLSGEARIIAPDLTVVRVPLRQVGPGRYEAALGVDQDGSWLAGIALRDGEEEVGQGIVEAVQPYSPEYRVQSDGAALLERLATSGHGGRLTDPAQAFERPPSPRRVPMPLRDPLLALAGLLLLLDVAARRLSLRRESGDTLRATAPAPRRRVVAGATPGLPPEPAADLQLEEAAPVPVDEPPAPPTPKQDAYVGGLLAARRKARSRTDRDGGSS